MTAVMVRLAERPWARLDLADVIEVLGSGDLVHVRLRSDPAVDLWVAEGAEVLLDVMLERTTRLLAEGSYRDGLRACFLRYVAVTVPGEDGAVLEFLSECLREVDRAPIPKLCRWLGYVQGVLIDRGRTTVEAERDWTRPLFRPLDFLAASPSVSAK